MFKLVVLSALVAVAVARPSVVGHSAVYAPVAAAVLPSAVSSQYRSDVTVSHPVVTAYAAPAVVTAHAAPALVTAHAAPALIAAPAAVSHSYRSDVISQPLIAAHVAPAVAYAAHVPSVHAW